MKIQIMIKMIKIQTLKKKNQIFLLHLNLRIQNIISNRII